jgi:hypothetical protein
MNLLSLELWKVENGKLTPSLRATWLPQFLWSCHKLTPEILNPAGWRPAGTSLVPYFLLVPSHQAHVPTLLSHMDDHKWKFSKNVKAASGNLKLTRGARDWCHVSDVIVVKIKHLQKHNVRISGSLPIPSYFISNPPTQWKNLGVHDSLKPTMWLWLERIWHHSILVFFKTYCLRHDSIGLVPKPSRGCFDL